MIGEAAEALTAVLAPDRLVFVLIGVGVGLVVGLLPGMGGLTGMAILLPFIYGMDPVAGIGMLIGMSAVTTTSDTFPAVLLGVPGSSAGQATIMDGYPLAQQGQASRALGAAFISNMVGGVIGATVLFVAIWTARPLVLALGSPEFFMLALLGLSMVAVLSRASPLVGLTSGLLGMAFGVVGVAPAVYEIRYTFDVAYLFDGISLPVFALGLFAFPEMLDLLMRNEAISKTAALTGNRLLGVKDAIRHRWLVLRSAVLGTVLGIIPGVGGSVVDWLAYGVTQQTSKNNEDFGKGDIRGVIGVESASNAKDGGSLVPTLLFGIPGSGTGAMLLGGLILLGIQPGPSMVSENIDITLAIVWTLALANIIATGACFALSKWVARVTTVPGRILVPLLLVLLVVAAYQNTQQWGDIVAFFVIGVFAWIMKQAGWPRPPALIGFVLAAPAERYLHISMSRYGYEWLGFPIVICIGLLIIAVVMGTTLQKRRRTKQEVQA